MCSCVPPSPGGFSCKILVWLELGLDQKCPSGFPALNAKARRLAGLLVLLFTLNYREFGLVNNRRVFVRNRLC